MNGAAESLQPPCKGSSRSQPNIDAIEYAVNVLAADGGVVELRAIWSRPRKRTAAGYFDAEHRRALAEHAARLNRAGAAVYVTMNLLDPLIHSRCANRVEESPDATATDANIIRRRWVLIDIDPVRPKGTSATDAQVDEARAVANRIVPFLSEAGFESIYGVRSGNGVHIFLPIDEPNDEATRDVVRHFLEAIAERFDTPAIKIDRSVFNAGRIVKPAGAVANKGDDTEAAPWRVALLVKEPEERIVAPRTILQSIAALAPDPRRTPKSGGGLNGGSRAFDVRDFLMRNDVGYVEDTHEGRARLKLKVCPFNADHGSGESAVFIGADGTLGFKCLHNGCSDRHWSDVRALFDGPREPRLRSAEISSDDECRADAPGERAHVSDYVPKTTPPPRKPQVKAVSDLIGRHFEPVKWAITDLIPEGVVLLVGAPKLGKSWLALQCGIAISAGLALWVGRRPELVGEVLLLALEDNDRRMASRVTKLLADGADVTRLHYATEWPRADRGGLDALETWLSEHPDCRLIVIDTLARWRGEGKANDSAYAGDYAVGSALKPLADRYGVAIVLVHHTRKAQAGDVLDAASGTLGLTGSVDAAMILRRERGAMDAALYVTGRDIEHEEDYALRFDPATCLWAGVGSVRDAQVSRERREILDFLSVSPMSRPKQIADGISKKSGAVRFLLHKMHASGEVEEIGGCYSVPTHSLTNSANALTVLTPLPPLSSAALSAASAVMAVSAQMPPCLRCAGEGCPHCQPRERQQAMALKGKSDAEERATLTPALRN